MEINNQSIIEKLTLPDDLRNLLLNARKVTFASKIEELEGLACGGRGHQTKTVSYELPDGGRR